MVQLPRTKTSHTRPLLPVRLSVKTITSRPRYNSRFVRGGPDLGPSTGSFHPVLKSLFFLYKGNVHFVPVESGPVPLPSTFRTSTLTCRHTPGPSLGPTAQSFPSTSCHSPPYPLTSSAYPTPGRLGTTSLREVDFVLPSVNPTVYPSDLTGKSFVLLGRPKSYHLIHSVRSLPHPLKLVDFTLYDCRMRSPHHYLCLHLSSAPLQKTLP